MSKYFYYFRPVGVESRYSLLVFNSKKEPCLPLTDHYHDCLKRMSKTSSLSYLKILMRFFEWLDEATYKGEKINWDEPPGKIRAAVEVYIETECRVEVRKKENFRVVYRNRINGNKVGTFLTALKSLYKTLIKMNCYKYPNPMINSGEFRQDEKEYEIIGDKVKEECFDVVRMTDSYFVLVSREKELETDDASWESGFRESHDQFLESMKKTEEEYLRILEKNEKEKESLGK